MNFGHVIGFKIIWLTIILILLFERAGVFHNDCVFLSLLFEQLMLLISIIRINLNGQLQLIINKSV